MDWKWKLALIGRSSEKGFAMPVAIGLGLVMMLVGATMIVRSQGDRVTAAAQRDTTRSLSAAEAGLTRIQAMFNQNRRIAQKNFSQWSNLASDPALATSCGDASILAKTAQLAAYYANTSPEWKPIDSTSQGQFKVRSYTYTPNSSVNEATAPTGTVLGNGELTIEGRLNQNGSAAKSSIRVNIPVTQTNQDLIPVPGLWIQSGQLGSNNIVQGDLVVTACDAAAVGGEIRGGTYSAPDLSFPAPPTRPPNLPPSPLPSNNEVANNTYYNAINGTTPTSYGNLTGPLVVPRTTDIYHTVTLANGTQVRVYQYRMSTVDLSGDVKILPGRLICSNSCTNTSNPTTQTLSNNKRVVFYIDNNVNTAGNSSFVHSCGTDPNCKPTDFQVFLYGDYTQASNRGNICLKGNATLDAFLFAPNGRGATAGSGGIRGSIWVKHWGTNVVGVNINGGTQPCSAQGNQTVVTQTAAWEDLGLDRPRIPPTIAATSSWQRLEVNP